MATKKAEAVAAEAPAKNVIDGSGASAKAARQAAHVAAQQPATGLPAYEVEGATFDPSDNSIDARMWRLRQDHIAMGSRK